MHLIKSFSYSLMIVIAFSACNKANKQQVQTTNNADTTKTQTAVSKKVTENTTTQIYAKKQIPVLCYHRISEGNKGDYTVSPATFEAHMKILADSGYHSILPPQLYDYLVYNIELPEKPFMITFDDSRIEHREIAAPVMEKNGFRGAFFIMTITYNKKNYMTTDQIAELAKSGHTIGLHTWDHTMVTKFKDSTDWQNQIIKPIEKLEKITNKPVEYFAYPNGVYNHSSSEELSKYIKMSFSLSTKRDSLLPLQCVRRIIVPDMKAENLLKSMRKSFN